MKLNHDTGRKGLSPIKNAVEKDNYPEITLPHDGSLKIPDSGTMTVKYSVIRRSEDRKHGGDQPYSCTVEIRSIVSARAEKELLKSPSSKTEDALDALRDAQMSKDAPETY